MTDPAADVELEHPIARAITANEAEAKEAGISARIHFANKLGVTPSAVAQWLSGDTAISLKHYENIERASFMTVRTSDLIAYERRRLQGKAALKAS